MMTAQQLELEETESGPDFFHGWEETHLPEEEGLKQIYRFNKRKLEDLKQMKKDQNKRNKWFNKEIKRLETINQDLKQRMEETQK